MSVFSVGDAHMFSFFILLDIYKALILYLTIVYLNMVIKYMRGFYTARHNDRI